MNISLDIGVWVGALFAIAIYSMLYKDNIAYSIVEHIFVGAATGHAVVVGVQTFKSSGWAPFTGGKYLLIVPMIFGVLLYTRYFSSVSWLNRWPLALMMGTSAGVAMRGAIESQIVAQVAATFVDLRSFDKIVIFLGTVFSLAYFFLTYEFKGKATIVPKLGRYFMMAAFGAAFGNTVMGRISAAIGRFQFIFLRWLGLGA